MKCLQKGTFENGTTRRFLIRFPARDPGRLSDDRRQQDVVLDLLVTTITIAKTIKPRG
jgi:hypothetical protein